MTEHEVTYEYIITRVEKPRPDRMLALGVCDSINRMTPGGFPLRRPVWPAVIGWAVLITVSLGALSL